MNKFKVGFIMGFVLVLIGCISSPEVKEENIKEEISQQIENRKLDDEKNNKNELFKYDGPFEVIKVVDGDTISVEINGLIEKLRLIGINTPETVDPRKSVQCFGKEASNKTKELLTGKKVYLESDSTQDNKDKYGRLLRYVILESGTNFNEKMIRDGYAYEYTYSIPYKYQEQFKDVEKEARKNKRGLWSDETCAGNIDVEQNKKPLLFFCDCNRSCAQLSCEEAQYQLNICKCLKRDGDKDGIACNFNCQ